MSIFLNPETENYDKLDEASRELMQQTHAFFRAKGKQKIVDDYNDNVWYQDFLDFVKDKQIFARLLTPSGYGDEGSRWDTRRICAFNELLGFYGLSYWYTWQVSILGLGPIWMGDNEEAKHKAAKLLQQGEIFAFGLSEKEHGADIYSSEMMLHPQPDGSYLASGEKYYIGNGNKAAMVSTFAKVAGSDDYVFFEVDSQHQNYECVKNTVASQNYVAHYRLNDYPISEANILSRGSKAWDCALNTINIGKYNLGWASVGICSHAFYEALNHASKRELFDHYVTDFPHIRGLFVDAFCRLTAMKLFALRASDYMRSASGSDRRYLLFNPMVKMKVTTEGEHVINHLWDVTAAKGFEQDQYFSVAAVDIRALPKLEGTVHVNMALIIKFMPNYFFNPAEFPDIPERCDASNDSFLFHQGPAKSLGKIQFHDFNKAYNSVDLPNVEVFKGQIEVFKEFMVAATPDEEQAKDIDFLLNVGELFTLVVYGQLVIESAAIQGVSDDVLDQIFDVLVRDFSKFALILFSKPSATEKQIELFRRMIDKAVVNPERFNRVWENEVYAMSGSYELK